MNASILKLTLSLLFMVSLQGCAHTNNSTTFFLRDDVDIGYIRRIAVLPFTNSSDDKFAALRARELTITQVLSQRIFDVVDKSEVDSALKDEVIKPGSVIDPATIRRLGQLLKVQAFLLGGVDDAGENRKGASAYPEITLTLRLIDSKSALVMWHASGHGSGYSTTDRLFGLNPADAYTVTMGLIDSLLSSIPRFSEKR